MIDLSTFIRKAILNDPLADDIGDYLNTKAVFTRRPAPSNANNYPMVFVSPQLAQSDNDFLNKKIRNLSYDVFVYGKNGTYTEYRAVEKIAFALGKKFARVDTHDLTTNNPMPTGYSLIKAVGLGPIIAPTDDNETVGRVVPITFTIQEN